MTYLYHLAMPFQSTIDDHLWRIHIPAPFPPNRVLMMSPAEHALVGTCHAGSHLHAKVRSDAIERVLVASATTTKHALGPSAQLYSAVRAYDFVPLLLQCLPMSAAQHVFWLHQC